MRTTILVVAAMVIAGVMVFGGMWVWQGAGEWVAGWEVSRPEVVVWAVKCVAVGAVAAAQVVLLALVCAKMYGRGRVDSALAFMAGAVCALAFVSAAAFGLAGR